MNLIQNIVIFVAKILIYIGDITLLIFSSLGNFIAFIFSGIFMLKNAIFLNFYRIKNAIKIPRRNKIYEKEIYNSEGLVSKFNIAKSHFQVPTIEIVPPKIEIPSIKKPKIKIPSLRLNRPKLNLRLPKFNFPTLHLRHKKRGRKRKLPLLIPVSTKFKYLFLGITASLFFFFLPAVFVIFIQNLPNPKELANQEVSQTTKIYDRNNELLYQIYANQNRTNVPLSKVPKTLREATIAIEDKNFYTNSGIDIEGIGRSAIADLSGKPLQGGSTITQQLIKARLLNPERSIDRKVKEIALAIWAQKIYTKDQILEMYLNQVPYGGTAWGAESGAQTYFGKNVEDLNLAESAFLAGLPQAPSIYSPYGEYPDSWKKRQKDVLNAMVNLNFITRSEADDALKIKLVIKPANQTIKSPHFVMYIKDLLVKRYGLAMVERGGLNVKTTLDLKTQDMAQKIVEEEVNKAGHLNFSNSGAIISNPKNGDILAMIGGKDYYDKKDGNYNITTALRQPGSTIKVVTYITALMNGFTPASILQDTPVAFSAPGSPTYSPVNYDGKFRGPITLRSALGNSINVTAVKTLNQVGIKTMMDVAKKMGVTTWEEAENYGLAITLGSAEVKMTDLATVYGTIANNGRRVDLNPFIKITNYQGAILEEKKEIKEKQVIPETVAFMISNILADNNARIMEFGLNSPLRIPGHTVSVKTGTTDNKRDNWTIGYTPNLLTAVWVGNNDNTPMNPILASGITGAAPIWNKIMSSLLSKSDPKNDNYNPPADIVIKSCGDKNEYFIRGTENQSFCRSISVNDKPPERLGR